jgi:hypothetical protein
MFVSDGYANTRVVKFDKDGKYLMAWGEKGNPPDDTTPGTFDAVHGVQVDPETRRVYVTDRSSHRIQTFRRKRQVLSISSARAPRHSADAALFSRQAPVGGRQQHVEDPQVRPRRPLPLFVGLGRRCARRPMERARDERRSGRQFLRRGGEQRPAQKFRPRAGANPAFMVGQPVRSAW